MKKQFLICMLALAGMLGNLCAQPQNWYLPGKSKTDQLFDIPESVLRHRFIIQLENANTITIQVITKEHFEALMNLDSLLRVVAKNLVPLKDSFSNELSNKRVDHLSDGFGRIKLRYKEYAPKGNSFVVMKDGLTPMKIEQDTLIIAGYFGPVKKLNNTRSINILSVQPYKITVLINNINDLEKIIDGTLNGVTQKIKREWDDYKQSPKNVREINLYGFYYVPVPSNDISLRRAGYIGRHSITPYVQLGIQNVNNLLATSIGAGIQLTSRIRRNVVSNYQLFWEPYFFFDKKTDGHFKLRRNDFATFQYMHTTNNTFVTGNVEFNQNLSIGYLINESGNYFYDNTFKFGLPGAKYKRILLHPEFVFNDLFKNFQPGLKLVLDLD